MRQSDGSCNCEIQVALSLLRLLIVTCYPISCQGAVVKTYDPIKKDAKWDLCQSLKVTNDVTSAIVVTQINPWGKTRDPDPILATVSLKSKSTSCIRKAFITCAMLRCSAAWSPEMIWCEDQGHAVWPFLSYMILHTQLKTNCYQQSCAATAICHSSASERKSKTSCGVVFGSCCENAAASLGGTLCDVANFPRRHWLIEQPPLTKVHHLLTCATPRSLGPNVAGQNGKHSSVASLPRRTNLKESRAKHEIPVQTFLDPRLYLLPKVGTASGSPANPASCSSKYRVSPQGLITLSIRYSREMDLAMI